jgi:imidazolonepropionase-like amidohydrolase
MGLVATGYDADLVILDGNPVADEKNLRRISAVVHGGYYRSTADLADLKARVAAGHGYLR